LIRSDSSIYGAVNEIVPANRLMTRAREIAAGIAKLPPLTSKYTRIGFTQRLRRLVDRGSGYGLALEGITAADVARISAPERDSLVRRRKAWISKIADPSGYLPAQCRAKLVQDAQSRGSTAALRGRSIPDRTKQRLGEEDLREAGDAGGPPRTRRQVEIRQACLPVGQVAPVAPATYQGFVKR
jgi:enoyl-CoA hydratase/carnithine racemase